MSFNSFDFVAVGWLIIGLFRGRKRGMSQEMLPMLQWIAIIVVAGLFYKPFAVLLRQYTQLDVVSCSIGAYVLIGVGIHLVYMWAKRVLGEKLVGSDLFGRAEYYFGMVAGLIRFSCMLIAFCALMNARIITKAELAATEKSQAQSFSDIRFPTFGSFQQTVLFQSFTGRAVEDNLTSVLISTTPSPLDTKHLTIAQKDQQLIDEVIGSPRKTH